MSRGSNATKLSRFVMARRVRNRPTSSRALLISGLRRQPHRSPQNSHPTRRSTNRRGWRTCSTCRARGASRRAARTSSSRRSTWACASSIRSIAAEPDHRRLRLRVEHALSAPNGAVCDGSAPFTTIDGDGDGPDADPTDPDDIEFDDSLECWVHNTLGDHGLWTAGIIGAVGNDGVGIAGVNWTVKIRPIRVLGITGGGTQLRHRAGHALRGGTSGARRGQRAGAGADRAPIINMSLGGRVDEHDVMRNAVDGRGTPRAR